MKQFRKLKVVCFGGGSGMPVLLSGLRTNPWLDVTAIVTMFDNGGSSGELRDSYGVLPPSDLARCLFALSENEEMARKILLERIHGFGKPEHHAANILLLGLEMVYGSVLNAVAALSQILSVRGRVIPVTVDKSNLCARYEDGTESDGETRVDDEMVAGRQVYELFLKPEATATEEALKAIAQADFLCVGPGSLYTSVLPNFLPKGINEAIAGSKAEMIFVCNLVTEGLGMKGMGLSVLLEEMKRFTGRQPDWAVINTLAPGPDVQAAYAKQNKFAISPVDSEVFGTTVIGAELWTEAYARHDKARLAQVVYGIMARSLFET